MLRLSLLCTAMLLPLALARPAAADDAADCQAAAGTLLTGTVVDGPSFKAGRPRQGVYLSHTHLTVKNDADGELYDVAIDNVFADGYQRNERDVPPPLSTIKAGDRMELCGQPYDGDELGIHWVHTNCGVPPTPDKPNGWAKEINADGSTGDNMEANQTYCSLWPN